MGNDMQVNFKLLNSLTIALLSIMEAEAVSFSYWASKLIQQGIEPQMPNAAHRAPTHQTPTYQSPTHQASQGHNHQGYTPPQPAQRYEVPAEPKADPALEQRIEALEEALKGDLTGHMGQISQTLAVLESRIAAMEYSQSQNTDQRTEHLLRRLVQAVNILEGRLATLEHSKEDDQGQRVKPTEFYT
ncbi:hypothetical protein [Leptolyngbya sp. FACHB-261]|uniref:hypothetical protein n=1 Tax=Leptolyngbya sp. FACHB-261 TaxID=2692806 RepID=UPI0016878178|nr:hypothetical protein [Leptolyngbya sp. FACHB-261]MBD2101953.1 hypothetical protein [Leptolyngbya sp. FACHB-261]